MPVPSPHPLRRSQRSSARLLGLASALALAVGAAILASPTAAVAAELGPGYHSASRPLDHLGGYLAVDGSVAYCIDIGLPTTVGRVTTDAGTVTQVNGLDPAAMLRLNQVLSRHGQTADPTTAAAVAMVVWSIAGAASYQSVGGDAGVLGRAPESVRPAIQALANQLRADAAAYVSPTARAALSLTIADGDDYSGTLEVSVQPATASGTVHLTNAVFSDTGSSSRTGVTDATSVAITAVPPSDAATYRASATAEGFTADGGPSASVRLFTTPGAQTLVAAGPPTTLDFAASAEDVGDRAVPTLTTSAQPNAVPGGTVRDTTTITGVPSSGVELRWDGYLQPVEAGEPECSAERRVFSTTAPVSVTADGSYTSEQFVVTDAHVGTIYWIGTASREGEVVAAGVCGDPTEMTVVGPRVRLPVVSG